MSRNGIFFLSMLLSVFAFQNCGSGYSKATNSSSLNSQSPGPGPSPAPAPTPMPPPTPGPSPAPTTPQSLLPNPAVLTQYCTTAEGYRVPSGTTVGGYFTNAKMFSEFSGNGMIEMVPGARARTCFGIGDGGIYDFTTYTAFCRTDGKWARFNIASQSSVFVNAPDVYGRFFPTTTPGGQPLDTVVRESTNSGGCIRFKDPTTAQLKTIVCGPRGCMPAVNNIKMGANSMAQNYEILNNGDIHSLTITNTTGFAVPNFKVTQSVSLNILTNSCDQALFPAGGSCTITFTNTNTQLLIGSNISGYFNVGYILGLGADPNDAYLIEVNKYLLGAVRSVSIQGVAP